ncbi:MAG: hypothetical protein ACKO1O_14645 [Erythrobacter sp.]
MKITLKDGTILEGEPHELAAFQSLRNEGASVTGSPSTPPLVENRSGVMTEEVAYLALTRLQLAPKIQGVMKALYEADDKWVSARELQRLIDYTPSQFAGLMGAFGRRLTNTPGFVEGTSFFEWRWDDGSSCYFYRLLPATRNAVRRAGLG